MSDDQQSSGASPSTSPPASVGPSPDTTPPATIQVPDTPPSTPPQLPPTDDGKGTNPNQPLQ